MGRSTTNAGCIKCGSPTSVTDARPRPNGDMRRRRQCTNDACGTRYSTLEILCGPHQRCNEIANWASEENRAMALEDGEQADAVSATE